MAKWTAHVSDERPCKGSLWVDVMRADGSIDIVFPALGWNWSLNTPNAILAWRESCLQFPNGTEGAEIILREIAA
jgi:hypothetical protein